MSVSMDKAGFDKLLNRISSVGGPREAILIGMESTACYHINLFSYLTYKGFNVIIINPPLISNFMKLHMNWLNGDQACVVSHR